MRRALIQMLENADLPSNRQKSWLEQLRGAASGNVNFSDLSGDEIRAQCAMITQAVIDQLPKPESAAVIGVYTRNPIQKAEAVRYLSTYLRPAATDSRQRLLFDYCVLRSLPRHGTQNVKSERQLLNLGVSDRSAAAYHREMRKRVEVLRKLGEDRMEVIFLPDGVIHAD